MKHQPHLIDRRQLLKLSAALGTVFVADAFGVAKAENALSRLATSPATSSVAGTIHEVANLLPASNFKTIYGDSGLRQQFFQFLQNVFHLYPEHKLHQLIEQTSLQKNTDKEIYEKVKAQLPEITPLLSNLRYALPALKKQKRIMTEQTLQLLGYPESLNGVLEVGSTGRYTSALGEHVRIENKVFYLHNQAPGYALEEMVERGSLFKRGKFLAMGDYETRFAGQVSAQSLDLVTVYIGFHHAPANQRKKFMQALHRVLRPGGKLIVRDHDVSGHSSEAMVALAHDVFNLGTGIKWQANHQEVRLFTSLEELQFEMAETGFGQLGEALYQPGDPTKNALMCFEKV